MRMLARANRLDDPAHVDAALHDRVALAHVCQRDLVPDGDVLFGDEIDHAVFVHHPAREFMAGFHAFDHDDGHRVVRVVQNKMDHGPEVYAQSAIRRNAPTAAPLHRWQNRFTAIVQLRTYIVEDNPTIRENLAGTLEELACVVPLGWAESESEACRWFAEHPREWDLAIVDLFLSHGSGLGVIEACRDRDAGQRVIVLSNYATPAVRQRCIELGADAVFDKSNEIDALIEYCIGSSNTA